MHDLVIRGGRVVDGTGRPAVTADVAVDGDRVVAVGRVEGRARHTIDADGALVTPGWVDIHTHYDGQASWDPELAPSSHHGVTTLVMGNCGVGFAPVRPGDEDFLIEITEGVEDIPGTALHEGIDWRWETFGEYLDALAELPRTVDVAALVGHAAVRAYVMGPRAHDDDLDADDLAGVHDVIARAVAEGALGASTSRTILHRSRHGHVPGTWAGEDELAVIVSALAAGGRGVLQFVSDDAVDAGGRAWLDGALAAGVPVTYSLAQVPHAPDAHRIALDAAADAARAGARVVPQVPARPTGMLFGWRSSFHPFRAHPTFRTLVGLPHAELLSRLRDPAVRVALLAEEPATPDRAIRHLATNWDRMFPLGDPPDYEPAPETSAAAVARRTGRTPAEVVYDWMLADEGRAFVFAPLGSYVDGDHEAVREMITHPASAVGLSDGGAHCGLICDASFPTYLLTHWVRDRHRGPRLPVELVVHKQTAATAAVFGLDDRGVLAPGKTADINVIDLDALHLHAPRMVTDLPAGGRRLLQEVEGYRVTVKSGVVTFVDGEPTAQRPGRVLRGTDRGVTAI
ncbi:MAG: D-aminoacylase [Actinomyces sp.]|nr:MAG: D-aminoacylase [Actinomyces sp.]